MNNLTLSLVSLLSPKNWFVLEGPRIMQILGHCKTASILISGITSNILEFPFLCTKGQQVQSGNRFSRIYVSGEPLYIQIWHRKFFGPIVLPLILCLSLESLCDRNLLVFDLALYTVNPFKSEKGWQYVKHNMPCMITYVDMISNVQILFEKQTYDR